MNKEEALTIVLADVCCSNGKRFCEICPLSKVENCEKFDTSEEKLMEAVKKLVSI